MSEPVTPSAPVSTPDVPKSPPLGRTLVFVVLTVLLALVIGAGSAAFVLHETTKFVEHEVEAQRKWIDQRSAETVETMRKIADEINTPPNNDKLFTVTTKSIGISEYEFKGTDSVTTTPEAAFATDLTAIQQTDAFTQQCTFHNTDTGAAKNLCVRPISWTVGTSCTAKCAASGFTCSNVAGTLTDGKLLQAGQEVTRDFDGTNCLCVVGSVVGGVKYQTERVVR